MIIQITLFRFNINNGKHLVIKNLFLSLLYRNETITI